LVIRRLANVGGVITDGRTEGFLQGPKEQWVDELSALALDHGIDSFVLASGDDLIGQTACFAEVAATTREVVAAHRSGSTT
jgi:hypothetical protein